MKRATLYLFYALLALSFVAVGARLVQMQVVDGARYQLQADSNRIREVSVDAPRGVIYDRNLRQLVSNQPAFSVAATEADLPEDPAALLKVPVAELNKTLADARKISPEAPNLLRSDLDGATAAAIAAHKDDWPGIEVMNEVQYNYITHHDNPIHPVTVEQNIPFETMQRVEEAHLDLPGISVVSEPVRQYALGSFMSHILGYVGSIPPDQYAASLPPEGSLDPPPYDKDDKVGLLGVEASMEPALRGEKGMSQIEVNANQREVREIRSVPPVPGQNVMLTIDSALQVTVTHLLQEG